MLAFRQLCLNCRSDGTGCVFGRFYSIIIPVRALERGDKIAVLLGLKRSVQSVVEHRVAHSGEPTAALFHEVHRRESLGNHGIAGARTIIAATEFCQSQRRWRITRACHDNAVGKDLDPDFATGVLVVGAARAARHVSDERSLKRFRYRRGSGMARALKHFDDSALR